VVIFNGRELDAASPVAWKPFTLISEAGR